MAAPMSRNHYIVPGIVGCALFMQMLDSTVVATALPAMGLAFGESAVRMNIAITSYLLAVAMFVPLSGWAADRFGARRVFAAAMLLFTLSSVVCSLAGTMTQLVAGRAFQGLAGAMMVPVGRVILLRSIPKNELVQAMSFLSVPALIGPVVGPPLGGFLVTYASWHWIFLINVPIGILGLVLVYKFIPASQDELTGKPLDLIGFLLTSISLVAIIFSLDAIGHSSMPAPAIIGLMLLGLLCALLYWRHARRSPHPIIDLSLLSIQTFRIANISGNLCRFAIGAMPFLLVMLLQVGFGLSPLAAGMITFVSAVGALLLKLIAVRVLRRFGFRKTLIVNAVTAGGFAAMCALFTPDTPYWVMLAVLLVGGFFRSLQLTAVNTLAYADVPHEMMSRASGFAAMAQQVGISLGVGLAAVTLNISMMLRGSHELAIPDVAAGFVVIGLFMALSGFGFARLPPHAGAEVSGRRAPAAG